MFIRSRLFLSILLFSFVFIPVKNSYSAEDWDFKFTPFFWLSSISGDVTVKGMESDVDVSFSEEKSDTIEKDMNDYLCKDIMRMTGEDRSVSLGILHCYMLGVTGTTKFNHLELLNITDRFVENCLDNPQSKALEVFKSSYKMDNSKNK